MNRPPVSRPPLSVVTSPPAMPVTYCIHTSYKKLLSKMGQKVGAAVQAPVAVAETQPDMEDSHPLVASTPETLYE